jgi:LacI family transcriptional regulator
VVVLDRDVPEHDVVLADHAQGGRRAAEHLIAAGHVHIGILCGPQADSRARDRAGAAAEVIERCGRLRWRVATSGALDLDPAATEALGRRDVTAVIAGSDAIAVGAVRRLQTLGLSVPDDVSIVGLDDSPWAVMTTPALSTIHTPIEAMATAAMETLVQRIAGDGGPRSRKRFDVALVERSSVRPPATG